MKFVGRPPRVPAVTQKTSERHPRQPAPTTCSVRRARALGCGRAAATNAMVAPAMRSNSRVSVP